MGLHQENSKKKQHQATSPAVPSKSASDERKQPSPNDTRGSTYHGDGRNDWKSTPVQVPNPAMMNRQGPIPPYSTFMVKMRNPAMMRNRQPVLAPNPAGMRPMAMAQNRPMVPPGAYIGPHFPPGPPAQHFYGNSNFGRPGSFVPPPGVHPFSKPPQKHPPKTWTTPPSDDQPSIIIPSRHNHPPSNKAPPRNYKPSEMASFNAKRDSNNEFDNRQEGEKKQQLSPSSSNKSKPDRIAPQKETAKVEKSDLLPITNKSSTEEETKGKIEGKLKSTEAKVSIPKQKSSQEMLTTRKSSEKEETRGTTENEVEVKTAAAKVAIPASKPNSQETLPTTNKSSKQQQEPILPLEAVTYLQAWANSPEHVAHPYPSEEEKAQMMRNTGLELYQIDHWFVNNRNQCLKRLQLREAEMSAPVTRDDTNSEEELAATKATIPQTFPTSKESSKKEEAKGTTIKATKRRTTEESIPTRRVKRKRQGICVQKEMSTDTDDAQEEGTSSVTKPIPGRNIYIPRKHEHSDMPRRRKRSEFLIFLAANQFLSLLLLFLTYSFLFL